MSDATPTPEQKLNRCFVLFTEGRQPEIDRLSIIMTLLTEMQQNERLAALTYASDYYGFRVFQK